MDYCLYQTQKRNRLTMWIKSRSRSKKDFRKSKSMLIRDSSRLMKLENNSKSISSYMREIAKTFSKIYLALEAIVVILSKWVMKVEILLIKKQGMLLMLLLIITVGMLQLEVLVLIQWKIGIQAVNKSSLKIWIEMQWLMDQLKYYRLNKILANYALMNSKADSLK